MAIIEERPAAQPVLHGPWARRNRIIGWTLALGWLGLFVSLVTVGTRESSYDRLEAALRSGEVGKVQVVGDLIPYGGLGYEGVVVRWRDGLVLRSATFTHATDEPMARRAGRDGSAIEPVVVGSVEDHLRSLDPEVDVRIVPGSYRSQSFSALGFETSGWFGLAYLVLLAGTLGLIAGPRPWRGTRWAWAWLILLAPAVGVPAYFLFGGPTGLFRPRPPARVWLTGGWAFILALLLGGAASS